MLKQGPIGSLTLFVNNTFIALANSDAYRATSYLRENLVVRVTRRLFRVYKKRIRPSDDFEAVLYIGRPNYKEREFIKLCKKAREPFPVKKVQIQLPPKMRTK